MSDNMDLDKSANGAGSASAEVPTTNPLAPTEALKRRAPGESDEANPQHEILPLDSATTRAEKVERQDTVEAHPSKRVKTEDPVLVAAEPNPVGERRKGAAPIKAE